jgi:hypothetical protein
MVPMQCIIGGVAMYFWKLLAARRSESPLCSWTSRPNWPDVYVVFKRGAQILLKLLGRLL